LAIGFLFKLLSFWIVPDGVKLRFLFLDAGWGLIPGLKAPF
jgi:hypothetical protein